MPAHEYTPYEALELLMRALRSRDEQLASEVQEAIDEGRDVTATERVPGRKKEHSYRMTVAYSPEEALQVAIDALRAYFVEQPMFVDSASDDLAQAVVGVPTGRTTSGQRLQNEQDELALEGLGIEKQVEIEIHTETQIARIGEETLRLTRVRTDEIEEQRQNINFLRKLATFEG
jgi:hypothetical protein